jgi:hypothetical protein
MNGWCGRVHTEMHRGESLYQRLSNTSCRTCGMHDSVADSPGIVAVPVPFATGTSSKSFTSGSFNSVVKIPSLAACTLH